MEKFEVIMMRRIRKMLREVGKKYDEGKPMINLVEPEFIEGLAKVLTFGAKKYGALNWQKGLQKERILAALYRHVLKYHEGQKFDGETGLHHLLHAAVNCMFLVWYDSKELQSENYGVKTEEEK